MQEFKEQTFWPTARQELLLRASLLKGKQATDAWEEWIATADIDHLDRGSFRTLPLLYRNLNTQGVKHPLMSKLRGIYRLSWYKNQTLFHHIGSVLGALHSAGIKTMILKGAAMSIRHYKDYGVRPMGDFDVLVKTNETSSVVSKLKTFGWQLKLPQLEEHLIYMHATPLSNGNGQEMDLHWHLLWESCQQNADKDFWEGALSIKIKDTSTYVLNPTDELFHTCIHGARWNSVPSFRWVADAVTLLRSSDIEIDWNRLAIQAQERRLILPLADTLSYLRDFMSVPIPSSSVERIRKLPASKLERIQYKYQIRNRSRLLTGDLLIHLCHYSRLTSNDGILRKCAGLPRYLQYTWKVEIWRMPFLLVAKCFRRIRAVVGSDNSPIMIKD